MSFWDEAFEDMAKETAKAYDNVNMQKVAQKSAAEHERGIRNGWWDSEGNNLLADDDEDEDE